MTLVEMSREYAASARQLSAALRVLRARLRECEDAEESCRLRQRITLFARVLTQARELERLTAHYYERGFWRDEKYTL